MNKRSSLPLRLLCLTALVLVHQVVEVLPYLRVATSAPEDVRGNLQHRVTC